MIALRQQATRSLVRHAAATNVAQRGVASASLQCGKFPHIHFVRFSHTRLGRAISAGRLANAARQASKVPAFMTPSCE